MGFLGLRLGVEGADDLFLGFLGFRSRGLRVFERRAPPKLWNVAFGLGFRVASKAEPWACN